MHIEECAKMFLNFMVFRKAEMPYVKHYCSVPISEGKTHLLSKINKVKLSSETVKGENTQNTRKYIFPLKF